MSNTNQPMTNSGLTFKKYDELRPFDVAHIRGEMLEQWDYKATDEEVAGVIDYIEVHAWEFLQDAIASVLNPQEPCPSCGQSEKIYRFDQNADQNQTPHP